MEMTYKCHPLAPNDILCRYPEPVYGKDKGEQLEDIWEIKQCVYSWWMHNIFVYVLCPDTAIKYVYDTPKTDQLLVISCSAFKEKQMNTEGDEIISLIAWFPLKYENHTKCY